MNHKRKVDTPIRYNPKKKEQKKDNDDDDDSYLNMLPQHLVEQVRGHILYDMKFPVNLVMPSNKQIQDIYYCRNPYIKLCCVCTRFTFFDRDGFEDFDKNPNELKKGLMTTMEKEDEKALFICDRDGPWCIQMYDNQIMFCKNGREKFLNVQFNKRFGLY